ncbi:MAG: hypothetical protein FJ319_02400 [SAR202 cluster bacterium]|nr:hypothetical protein [SAR202 cluster bacterium]
MVTKEQLHRLIDELPDSELLSAARYLKSLRDQGDPFLRALLNAPIDDEPETEEEREGVAEAWQEYLDGKARPLEEVIDELRKDN